MAIVGAMTWHYYKTSEGSPEVLARIDIDRFAADRYDQDGWTVTQGLMRVALTDDNMDFVEIDRTEAEAVVRRRGFDLTQFDEPSQVRDRCRDGSA